ncbi:MAG: PD-(D/E)XK nuclease family protein [Crocinitomicaceae bacterium]
MQGKKFITRIADFILENEWPLEDLVIILPSIRARKYLETELASKFERPIFAPEMLTIDSWIKNASTYKVVDKLNILFELYRVHLEIEEDTADRSFDAFYNWATILLADFEEIDKYLVDPKQLFKNLKDVKDIENWSFNSEELSETQLKFLAFWERLPHYYEGLRERLKKNNWAYGGMAFREVAENNELVSPPEDKRIFIFAGFNALSLSEMTIIRKLHVRGKAHILQNIDEFYYKAKHHEAGHFQRTFNDFLGRKPENFMENDMLTETKNIELISCAQSIAQVKAAASILSKMNENELNETVLLLADETLAGPMMKNLPLNIGRANITMGLQLRDTSVKLWVDLLFSIQENFTRFKTKSLYHKDLFKLWQHPFYQAFTTKEIIGKQRSLENYIISKNRIFLSPNHVSLDNSIIEKLIQTLLQPWNNDFGKALQHMRQLNQLIYPVLQKENEFEKAILRTFDKAVLTFQNTLGEDFPEMSLRTFKLLFHQNWSKQRIAYEGTPTEGLQMMGLLETRMLDFKNIICLGLNEGTMPPGNPIQTLIPMDLRHYFGMPGTRDKQGLFAHHFYRLLHKMENMTITYTEAQESLNSGEPSRYIQQMRMEWERLAPNVSLTEKTYALEASAAKTQLNSILKTPEIFAKMDRILENSISASALNKYLSCPMDFYYRYILEYGEEEEVEEEMNNNTLGTIIHAVLEILYEPFAHKDSEGRDKPNPKSLSPVDIARMEKEFPELVKKEFKKNYDDDENSFATGKNHLSYQMAISLLQRFFQEEKKWLMKLNQPLMIHSLEQKLETTLKLIIHGVEKTVNLKGFIDRVDGFGDKTRIIDYKSGRVNQEEVNTNKNNVAENLLKAAAKGKVLQLWIYAYLFRETYGYLPDEVTIISFINYPEAPLSLQTGEMTLEEFVDALPTVLTEIFEEMYDPTIPFVHNSDQFVSYCQYC